MAAFEVELADEVHKAGQELLSHSIEDIHRLTAIAWCGRTIAAYSLYVSTGNRRFLLDAADYEHEAIEHAALAGPDVYHEVFGYVRSARTSLT
jgi:hypothetical protein